MARPVIDISGEKFGKLSVVRKVESQKGTNALWLCRCDCGNEIIVNGYLLRSGMKTNCGCEPKFNSGRFAKGEGIKDISGKRFGKLIVLSLDKVKNNRTYWWVKCDCGTIKSVRGDTLKVITSCGCDKKKQDIINLNITNHHELTHHPAYHIWSNMISRCDNTKDHAYADYGGRGINVCDEWHDIRKFCEWADKNGFEGGRNLSIERIDVNGNYCPDNCCWIPRSKQPRNRRCSIRLEINGEEKPLREWAEIYGFTDKEYQKITQRYRAGHRDPEYLFFKGKHKTGYKPKHKNNQES